jgi:hypothetical protein
MDIVVAFEVRKRVLKDLNCQDIPKPDEGCGSVKLSL